MTMYRVLAVLPIGAGTVVKLKEAQVKPRAHLLQAETAPGCYRATGPLQFKAGEEIGIEGELPRVHQERVRIMTASETGLIEPRQAKRKGED